MDPITMMLIAQGVAGIGKAGYGAYQKRKGKQALASSFEAPTGTPSEYADLIQQARASDLSQRRIDEINRSMATSTAALQQSGTRGVIGGIGAVTAAGAGAKTQALSQQQQEVLQALGRATTGAEYQRRRDVMRQNREEDFAINAIQAGAQNITGGVGDVMQAGLSYGQGKAEGLIKTGADKSRVRAQRMSNQTQEDIFQKSMSGLKTVKSPMDSALSKDQFKTLTEGFTGELSLSDLEQLEDIEEFKDGGVKKTPGAFSHSSNPIDIMKDGAKIGEMTGGEYIFNPKQAKQMQKFAKSGSSDLHKFVRTLLNKPQFK
jgi:hypothetical protein